MTSFIKLELLGSFLTFFLISKSKLQEFYQPNMERAKKP